MHPGLGVPKAHGGSSMLPESRQPPWLETVAGRFLVGIKSVLWVGQFSLKGSEKFRGQEDVKKLI